jgi:hypothetical protein
MKMTPKSDGVRNGFQTVILEGYSWGGDSVILEDAKLPRLKRDIPGDG